MAGIEAMIQIWTGGRKLKFIKFGPDSAIE